MCPIAERRIKLSIKTKFGKTWNNAPRHTTSSRQTATRVDETEGLRCRVRAAATLFSFGSLRIGSFHSQGALGGRRKPSSATCRTAAVMQLSRSRAYPPFFSSFARFSRLLVDRAGRKIGIAAAMITFEAPPTGYVVLWCVGVGAAIAPVTSR